MRMDAQAKWVVAVCVCFRRPFFALRNSFIAIQHDSAELSKLNLVESGSRLLVFVPRW